MCTHRWKAGGRGERARHEGRGDAEQCGTVPDGGAAGAQVSGGAPRPPLPGAATAAAAGAGGRVTKRAGRDFLAASGSTRTALAGGGGGRVGCSGSVSRPTSRRVVSQRQGRGGDRQDSKHKRAGVETGVSRSGQGGPRARVRERPGGRERGGAARLPAGASAVFGAACAQTTEGERGAVARAAQLTIRTHCPPVGPLERVRGGGGVGLVGRIRLRGHPRGHG